MAGLRTQEVFGKMRACVAPMGSCYMYMHMHMYMCMYMYNMCMYMCMYMHMYRRKCNCLRKVSFPLAT